MAIAFVDDYWDSVNSTVHNLTMPSYSAGDVALLFYGANGTGLTRAITIASGWTELVTNTKNLASDHNQDRTTGMFYKVLTASESNPRLTMTGTFRGGSPWVDASIQVFRGVDNTTPFDVTTVIDDTDVNSADCPDITTVTAAAALVIMAYNPWYASTSNVPTSPSGFVKGTAVDGYFNMGYLIDAGSAGLKTIGNWGIQNTTHAMYTAALRPAGTPAAGTSLYLGSTEHNKVYLGSTSIAAIYLGSTKTFEAP